MANPNVYNADALSYTTIVNIAATALDDDLITDVSEDTALARFAASQFGSLRDQLLRAHPWTFARTRITLAPDAQPDGKPLVPGFGWTYRYTLPKDCLRLLPLSWQGALDGEPIPYEREGLNVYTNAGPSLPIKYVRRMLNPSEFDPLFARCLGLLLALSSATRTTGKANYFDRANGLYQSALHEAWLVNSLDGSTPEHQNRNDIIDVRSVGNLNTPINAALGYSVFSQ